MTTKREGEAGAVKRGPEVETWLVVVTDGYEFTAPVITDDPEFEERKAKEATDGNWWTVKVPIHAAIFGEDLLKAGKRALKLIEEFPATPEIQERVSNAYRGGVQNDLQLSIAKAMGKRP